MDDGGCAQVERPSSWVLLLFIDDNGGLYQQNSTLVCIWRQGQSIGGSVLSGRGGDQLGEVQEVHRLLLLRCFDDCLLGGFFVERERERERESLQWQISTWVCWSCWGEYIGSGCMTYNGLCWSDGGPKVGHFSTLFCFAALLRVFLGYFLARVDVGCNDLPVPSHEQSVIIRN